MALGGCSARNITRGSMPATMFRLNVVHGLGPASQIAEGETVALPENTHRILEERINPTWPTTWFVLRLNVRRPFTDTYSLMNNWGADGCVMRSGHIGADLISPASVLRISVCMQNAASAQVFRSSAWLAFGIDHLMGADSRACANFGPLY